MNTKENFLILLNSYLILMKIVFKMLLGGCGGGDVKGPRADDMPRAPRTVNPALTVTATTTSQSTHHVPSQ